MVIHTFPHVHAYMYCTYRHTCSHYMYITHTHYYMHEVDTIVLTYIYSETSLIRHSMGPENNVGLEGCWIMECLLPYLCMVTVPHIMVGLERMLDYRGVGLARFHCTQIQLTYMPCTGSITTIFILLFS